MKKMILPVVGALLLGSCANQTTGDKLTASGLDPQKFVAEYRGDSTELYSLVNANGMEVCITNFGGRIVSVSVPDRDGKLQDVVLGFDSIQAYFPENNRCNFGAVIGRYGNRINQGRFTLNDSTYQLPQNNYGHNLHGCDVDGSFGWQDKVFKVVESSDTSLVLALDSPDGDNGFPGNVKAQVTYTLLADNSLDVRYEATTDKPTIINMTNHSYFNLSGDPNKPITDQELMINASAFTPVDSTFMTTGEILPVEGTPMDFRKAKLIGAEIERTDYVQIKNALGYDHNWVLDTPRDTTRTSGNVNDISTLAASVYCPATGIEMQIFTDEPGIQVYAGNFLDGTVTGKHNIKYNKRTAICLETQHYPDSPNKPQWPSVVLLPDTPYASHTVFHFTTK